MPSRATIDELLAQRDLAFVGVSRDPKAFANTVYRALKGAGHVMHPVHREADVLEGDACVKRLTHLPKDVGGVVVMVPAAHVLEVVREAVAAGIPRVWLHRGLGEKAVSPEAVAHCREHGVAVVDGACPLMFLEPVSGFHRFHRVFFRHRLAA